MAEKYKDILYRNYRSTHNDLLYGELSLLDMNRSMPVLNYYFGPHLPSDKNAMILDVGCGEGSFVYFLQKLGYNNTSGIDLSEEQIRRGNKLGIDHLIVRDLVDHLSSGAAIYDLIIARDVIEHFTRQEAFEIVTQINRSLKPNGRFIMQVPNGQGLFYTSIFFGDFTHEMAYTESSVSQLFLNAGFKESRCYPTGPVPHSIFGFIRKILWSFKVVWTRFWKLVETGNGKGIFTSNLIAVGIKG